MGLFSLSRLRQLLAIEVQISENLRELSFALPVFSLSLSHLDVGLIEDFVKYSVWVDVGAVGVGFIDDLSC